MAQAKSDCSSAAVAPTTSAITITEPTIQTYFATLNAADFQATANLFAAEGQLLPPFEAAIIGREAILAYLETEARGMLALPQAEIEKDAVLEQLHVTLVGKVQTSLFTVNVQWHFLLNAESEILSMKVKLLASLQDLLNLKRSAT